MDGKVGSANKCEVNCEDMERYEAVKRRADRSLVKAILDSIVLYSTRSVTVKRIVSER